MHFEKECFDQKPQKRFLKKNSVPTLFCTVTEIGCDVALLDHNYVIPSQNELKRRLNLATDVIDASKKKIKVLQNAQRRTKIKCNSLVEIIAETKKKNLLSESVCEKLNELSSKFPIELFRRLTVGDLNETISRKQYPEEIKKFALTLQFYSTKGYNYVQETFLHNLPHENTIRRWYSSVLSETGNCYCTKLHYKTIPLW